MSPQIYKAPTRFLFIASIGNPAPYTGTRHSAGHVLLDAIQPQLHERIGLTTARSSSSSSLSRSIFYSTWKSPSLMNVSGPPVLRQFKTWATEREKYFTNLVTNTLSSVPPTLSNTGTDGNNNNNNNNNNHNHNHNNHTNTIHVLKSSSTPITIDIRALKHRFRPTLVILHDELEARPGQIRVRRGGPQQASLRGHRGLISIMESLRGAGLLSSSSAAAKNLSILRIGIGIGRPASRERGSVSDYVLAKMGAEELQALSEAVPEVVDTLVQEMYRRDEDEV
ncbi:hypothetical protein UA08_02764 [Talaromyces atroroseus]|uniref:Peptidyl-tRNA hydrolase n=1 Tax=Talaromyces atroroseus TaxID=1441469 RepID=A0A225B8A6_TALAT|nr:hypothetical protein UA08_02764 [Talaromyces atroroseus]OKL62177.1 hypothetical protein UA08_02764 [Talaromyces atroroseus]